MEEDLESFVLAMWCCIQKEAELEIKLMFINWEEKLTFSKGQSGTRLGAASLAVSTICLIKMFEEADRLTAQ